MAWISDDTFTGSDNDPVDSGKWSVDAGDAICDIQNNKCQITSTAGSGYYYAVLAAVGAAVGNLEFLVDVVGVDSGDQDSAIGVQLLFDGSTHAYVFLLFGDGTVEVQYYDGSSQGSLASVAAGGTAFPLKITREGSTLHFYYYDSSWIEVGTGYDHSLSSDVTVSLISENDITPAQISTFDNVSLGAIAVPSFSSNLEGEGDIVSAITGYTLCLAPVECDGAVYSRVLSELVTLVAVEGESDLPEKHLVESVVNSYPTGDGWATDRGLFSAICSMEGVGDGEIAGQTLISFFVDDVCEGEGDIESSVLSAFISAYPVEGEGSVSSMAAKGYSVLTLIEGEGEVITDALASYGSSLFPESEGEVSQSVIASFSASVAAEGEGDTGRVVKTWSIVQSSVEGVAEIPAGILEAVSSLMLALYGQSVQATTFSNYSFDSFIEHNGKTYASAPDGIHEIGESDTDNGTDIVPSATVNFRKLGSNKGKQLRSIYADGGSKCVADLDGVLQEYLASSRGRFDCRHDHTGKELKLTFSDFESLSDVEIFLYLLSR